MGAGDVAEDDGRLDVPRPVGLDPAEAGEGEAGELLAEVFDHVVALWFAVDEDVEVEVLLELHDLADLVLDDGLVAGFVELAVGEAAAGAAEVVGLGEGADGRRGEGGEAEAGALGAAALFDGAGAAVVGLGDGTKALLGGGVVDAGRGAARLEGGAVGGELVGDGLGVVEGGGEGGDLVDLLMGEGEPALDVGVEGGLALESERDVHEAAGGGDDDAVLADAGAEFLEERKGGVEVVDPDVAAVDDTSHEVFAAGEAVLADEVGVAAAAPEVEADGGHGEGGEGVVGLVDVAEVGLNQELRVTGF